jgi:hypothetical protein
MARTGSAAAAATGLDRPAHAQPRTRILMSPPTSLGWKRHWPRRASQPPPRLRTICVEPPRPRSAAPPRSSGSSQPHCPLQHRWVHSKRRRGGRQRPPGAGSLRQVRQACAHAHVTESAVRTTGGGAGAWPFTTPAAGKCSAPSYLSSRSGCCRDHHSGARESPTRMVEALRKRCSVQQSDHDAALRLLRP